MCAFSPGLALAQNTAGRNQRFLPQALLDVTLVAIS